MRTARLPLAATAGTLAVPSAADCGRACIHSLRGLTAESCAALLAHSQSAPLQQRSNVGAAIAWATLLLLLQQQQNPLLLPVLRVAAAVLLLETLTGRAFHPNPHAQQVALATRSRSFVSATAGNSVGCTRRRTDSKAPWPRPPWHPRGLRRAIRSSAGSRAGNSCRQTPAARSAGNTHR